MPRPCFAEARSLFRHRQRLSGATSQRFLTGKGIFDTKTNLAKVKVRLFFDLIPSSNKSELELEAGDLHGLLDSLNRKMGENFRQPLFDSHGKPRPYSLVYHNGKSSLLEDASNFRLKDGDVVLFVPPVGGG